MQITFTLFDFLIINLNTVSLLFGILIVYILFNIPETEEIKMKVKIKYRTVLIVSFVLAAGALVGLILVVI